MKALRKALLENEDWLMERVRDYALAQGYTRYTSTLVSAWKISIVGLSEALAQSMNQSSQPLDFGPDDTFQADPAAAFAIKEAKLHRERGISLVMFLGLLKYYRQTYLDLVAEKVSRAGGRKARGIVARFFDRVEIGVALEWSACERDDLLHQLQEANRSLTNEKNKYLTVFESLALPVFLFDTAGRLVQENHAATRWLRRNTSPGLEYYLEKSAAIGPDAEKTEISVSEILPDLAADILGFCGQAGEQARVERAIRLGDEERFYLVSLGRQLDFSSKFAGVVVTLEDITARRTAESLLIEKKERLSEAARQRMRQLKAANQQLEREIAQRAALEEALRKGAQYYRAIVEDQTEMVCRFTPDCVLTFVNQAYCRFSGKSETQLLGRSFLPFIPESQRASLLDHLRAITPQSSMCVVEHAATAADGGVRWHRWTDRGFFDAAGNLVEFQAVGSDITDRHQAEEELKRLNAQLEQRVQERTRIAEDKAASLEQEIRVRMEAERRLKSAYDMMAIQNRMASVFLTVPGDEIYSRVLHVLLETTSSKYGAFGYLNETGELVAPSMTDEVWKECQVPGKTHRFPKESWRHGLWSQALREGRLQVKNSPCAVPEGHVPLSSALAAPIVFQREVIGLVVLANRPGGYTDNEMEIVEDACRHIAPVLQARLAQERTEAERRQAELELRESRAMLRQILDSVPQAIFWKDADSVFLGCNEVFARIVGFASPEDLVGRTDYDLPVPRAEAEAYRADDAEVMASKRPKLHILEPLQQADGSRLWIDTTKMPLLDAESTVRGVLGVFEDVTEKKQAEEALRQSEELFRNLFERHAAVKLILDPDTGAILDANRAAEEFYGWPRTQLRTMRIQDINTLPPEVVKQEMEEVRANERVYFEFRHRRADGSIRDVAVFTSKFEMKGRDILHSIVHDISDRKRIEAALRESEERHRALFESMAEGACILDAVRDEAGEMADYRIVDVNPAFTGILDLPRERAIGALVRELFGLSEPPDLEQYSRVLETWAPVSFETLMPQLGKHFHVSASRLGPDRFVAMFQDITQRKRAEDALRRRLELEQVLAGVSGQLVGMLFEEMDRDLPPLLGIVAGAIGADLAQVCTLGSEAPCQVSWNVAGEPGEAICTGSTEQTHPWIVSRLRNLENILLQGIEDMPPEAAAERDILARRGVRSLLVVPLAKGEALSGCLAFMAVRERREWPVEDVSLIETFARILANAIESARLGRTLRYNERRYFELIDNLSEGLWVVDREGKTTFINKSMAQMLGYEPREMLGQEARGYVAGDEARDLDQKLSESRQGVSHHLTMEFLHKDGRRVFVSLSGRPVRNEQGEIVGSMALINDLSKERLLQLQLIQAQRLEAIGQLASGIAHEINTPAQYVDNNTQFLRGAFDDLLAVVQEYESLLQEARAIPSLGAAVHRVDNAKEERQAEAILADIPGAFNDAGDGLQRISLIVDSVKRFAHPGHDAIQPADINDAVRSTIVVARNEWKYVAEVATELDPALPPVPCVLSDINQVVLNLIVNAAHAIAAVPDRPGNGKGLITVRTRTEDGWAVIAVQDTGTGIPAAIRPRIFDPFFTTKEVGKGTGQGLAIARTVVAEKHHGSITFETEEGQGTTFFVRLPLKQTQEQSTQ